MARCSRLWAPHTLIFPPLSCVNWLGRNFYFALLCPIALGSDLELGLNGDNLITFKHCEPVRHVLDVQWFCEKGERYIILITVMSINR